MYKRIAATALAASCALSLSAKDKKVSEGHDINFEQVRIEASERNTRHLVSTSRDFSDTYAYLFGKVKLTEGRSGQAVDFSDSRTRTEFRIKTGKFYNHNGGSMSFWISPTKEKFGIDKKESAIFEESNGDTLLGLYLDDKGFIRVKVSSRFPVEEEKKEKTADKFTEKDFIEKLLL